jgi:circadian clock protein KaiB
MNRPADPVSGAIGTEAETEPDPFLLQLFVAGQSPRSVRAVQNMQSLCAHELHGIYRLEVIDLYQQPQLASDEQIVALPAVVKRRPLPVRMVIGDMSDSMRVLVGLDLRRL